MSGKKKNPIVFTLSILLIPAIPVIGLYLYSKPEGIVDITMCSISCGILYLIFLWIEGIILYSVLGGSKDD